MEIELKLPYAECYTFSYPQKIRGKKKLYEYVRKAFMEVHPGFCDESLWDYKVIKETGGREIIGSVLEKDFFLEKRLSQKNVSFFIKTGNDRKIRLFRNCTFNEKGERRTYWKIIALTVFITVLISVICIYGSGVKAKRIPVISEPSETEEIQDALNGFDLMNSCAQVIKKHGGKAALVQYIVKDRGMITFSLSGCEPYELVCDLEKMDFVSRCRCEDVVYSGGKENFVITTETKSFPVLQKIKSQTELLEILNSITKVLQEPGINLVSSRAEEGSGLISLQLECNGENLSDVNRTLDQLCLREKLFVSGFSEMQSEGNGLFLVKADFISLEDIQNIKTENTGEKLSCIFEMEKMKPAEKSSSEKKAVVLKEDKTHNLKKIGQVQKEGKILYYYRTEEGKIQMSEVDYE